MSWLLHEFVGLGPTFDNSRFVTVWSIADNVCYAACKKYIAELTWIPDHTKNSEHIGRCRECGFETNLPRLNVALDGCFGHHLPDEVVRKQVRPKFIADTMRFLAPKMLHLHDGLETSEI